MDILNIFIGVVVGAVLGMAATIFYDIYKEHRTRKRVAIAIAEEIKSLKQLVKDKWGPFLEGDPNKIEKVELTSRYNYFTVYESHTALISLFDQELVKRIVHFYNNAKAFLEDIKLYCERVKNYSDDEKEELIHLRTAIKSQYEQLTNEADSIIESTNQECRRKFLCIVP